MEANPPGGFDMARGARTPTAMFCYSHLRWGFVWQRPQHLLSRFSTQYPVFVIEEPDFVDGPGDDRLETATYGNVTVLTPMLVQPEPRQYGFNELTNQAISRLLTRFVHKQFTPAMKSAVVSWYYTPMALGAEPLGVSPAVVVYDVMDELANFVGAPLGLREREHALFRRADLVFTGGPSLYEARHSRHPHVYCFPSGVDASHFAQARQNLPRPAELAGIDGNIVGFYGVLDERLDRDLLTALAAARPEWTFVMIGPVVKIADSDLPAHPNIRYLGKREYAELPSYLRTFDAAVLPFALNDATRFISPTKTLEYLAAGKPVVSTPIKDVVDLYGDVVEIAATPAEFIAAIERLWAEPDTARVARSQRAQHLLTEYAWNAIAARMSDHIARRLRRESLFAPFAIPSAAAEFATLGAGASD